ncbi:lactonase family protein [Pontiella agarivorans]|uniref:Lactonase family protein n=1 Tax=Pontiella agarivorans TaxID=3038953 RepID=A0ABU5MZF1_9BACT|nr:lactonase family protein [Pontiella agarivorans]MDZ8119589.1 lactonase family protein [Pontiella agarivorans]
MKAVLLSLAVASLLSGCATAKIERVYIGTGKDGGIYFTDLDTETGQLSPPVKAADTRGAGFITVSPDNRLLYATGVASFKISDNGTLTPISEQQTGEKGSCHVSTDRTGQMLMTAYYGSGSVASFKISDGTLSEAISIHRHTGSGKHPQRQKKAFGHSVYPNPENTHAYVADLGIDKIMIYSMNPEEGSLAPAGEAVVPGGAMGPRHMKFSADGKRLYVLNELDLSLSVFQCLENGRLNFLSTTPMLPENADKNDLTAAEIRIHPNGKLIYTSLRDRSAQRRDALITFRITATGAERIKTTPAQVWFPRNFNIDSSGQWLIVGGQLSKDIVIFSIDPKTADLTFTDTRVALESEPICFEFIH